MFNVFFVTVEALSPLGGNQQICKLNRLLITICFIKEIDFLCSLSLFLNHVFIITFYKINRELVFKHC